MPRRSLPSGMTRGSRPPSSPSSAGIKRGKDFPGSLGNERQGMLRDFNGRFAGGGVTWYGLEATQQYLEDVERKTQAGAQRAAQRIMEQTVLWMKANAPWKDRTGEAREGLKGQVQFDPNAGSGDPAVRIFLGHSAEHGVHLELGMGGRFQIIRPAMQRVAQKLPSSIIQEAGL